MDQLNENLITAEESKVALEEQIEVLSQAGDETSQLEAQLAADKLAEEELARIAAEQ